ncbi:MAG: nucleoside deaminase [Rickettsiales bacterium]
MQRALELAQQAARDGEVPVGAVVVHGDKIIGEAANTTEAACDPTGHAEMLAIRAACETLGNARLTDCDVYVTLEPCPMCAQAISFARIRRLYFGAYDAKGGGVENGPRIFSQPTCHHKPEIYGGMCERECAELLKAFFKERRA